MGFLTERMGILSDIYVIYLEKKSKNIFDALEECGIFKKINQEIRSIKDTLNEMMEDMDSIRDGSLYGDSSLFHNKYRIKKRIINITCSISLVEIGKRIEREYYDKYGWNDFSISGTNKLVVSYRISNDWSYFNSTARYEISLFRFTQRDILIEIDVINKTRLINDMIAFLKHENENRNILMESFSEVELEKDSLIKDYTQPNTGSVSSKDKVSGDNTQQRQTEPITNTRTETLPYNDLNTNTEAQMYDSEGDSLILGKSTYTSSNTENHAHIEEELFRIIDEDDIP